MVTARGVIASSEIDTIESNLKNDVRSPYVYERDVRRGRS
jgi:hypothetical protein